MTKHGFGRNALWKVSHQAQQTISMKLTDRDINDEAKKEFPDPFDATITVTAEPSGCLLYSLSVKNPGAEELLISPGLHPYWAIIHAQKRTIKIDGITGFDEGG